MSQTAHKEVPLRDGEVSIAGLDKAVLLAALYNRSSPMGMGVFQARPGSMTLEQAKAAVGHGDDSSRMFDKNAAGNRELYFDYLYGRPLKIDISGDVLRTWLYNRDNGNGMAEKIVAELHAQAAS